MAPYLRKFEKLGFALPINNLTLRKALKLAFSDPASLRTDIRAIIRADRAREAGTDGGGGDFYGPFWYDAKQHVLGLSDLHVDTQSRIDSNPRRQNLYPQLRDGFLLWWSERRRWVNSPYEQGDNHFGQIYISQIGMTIRVENLISVIDGHGDEYAVYPYFSPEPNISEDAGRFGLWGMTEALTEISPSQLRLLDVIRGQSFSLDRSPLQGNEQEVFTARLSAVIEEYEALLPEYE